MKTKTKIENIWKIIIVALVISVSICMCCFMDFFIVTCQGLSYINKSKNKYFCNKIEIDDEIEFSLTLDKSGQNLNKCIYNTDNNKIFITEFIVNDETYIIFRSYGQYSLNGAQLVTCVNYDYVSDDYEKISIFSSLYCSYDDENYECLPQGYTWCSFKDGNMFGYYIPKEIVQKNKNENAEINFHLKGLIKYTWNKK